MSVRDVDGSGPCMTGADGFLLPLGCDAGTTLGLVGGMISLLGMVRFVDADGVDVELRSPNQRRLLCALALAGGDTIRADYLGEVLGMAPSALRTGVSRLRSLVGDDVIVTDGPGYYVRAEIDSQQFEYVVTATTSRGRDRLTDLEEALALWHGPAVDEFSHEANPKLSEQLTRPERFAHQQQRHIDDVEFTAPGRAVRR